MFCRSALFKHEGKQVSLIAHLGLLAQPVRAEKTLPIRSTTPPSGSSKVLSGGMLIDGAGAVRAWIGIVVLSPGLLTPDLGSRSRGKGRKMEPFLL